MQYESRLEELRQLRKSIIGVESKKSLADHAIVRRIHFIYERATRKFRGDLRLWSSWLQFCKDTNSNKRLSQVGTCRQQKALAGWHLYTQARSLQISSMQGSQDVGTLSERSNACHFHASKIENVLLSRS